ncbi:MAG TPA: asparagine synthase (glutamine-hydrolyzing) [Gemmatimonadales bacterium]|nr:asparagine synthase (glutamine-hydrolyzing) [Gemmatimonadales bacterium]
MCGIAGVVWRRPADHEALAEAQRRIAHRGPDDAGACWWTHQDYSVGLASQRLAILDLSPAGRMPMSNPAGTVWIVYNGEVYNFRELRRELEARGHTFHSSGDTEVVLRLYETEGPGFIRRLNGIFAFAIWDARNGTLMLGRDRFGVKPLYYQATSGDLFFASEIGALFAFPGVRREVDPAAIAAAATYLGAPGSGTGFRDVHKLEPAHYLLWRDGAVSRHRYWELIFDAPRRGDEALLAAEFRDLLGRVVRRQMVSDVPLGAFLSGGLDSSALVAMMARASDRPVTTYTIAYRQEDQRWERAASEAPYARLMAESVGAEHHEIVVDPEVVSLLPTIVRHLEEPVGDPAAISTYLICRAARPQLTVLLAGQGADEVLAGYHFYQAEQLAARYGRVPRALGQPVARIGQEALYQASRIAPGGWAGRVLGARRFADLIGRNAYLSPAERHAEFHAYFPRSGRRRLFTPEFAHAVGESPGQNHYLALFGRPTGQPVLNRQLYTDLGTHLPDLILNYSDKLSMAASVELRVPFLDNELVEFASRLPPGLKLRGGTGKYLFRRAMEPVLPPAILRRRKMPFGVPIRSWLRHELRPMVDELLAESVVRRRGYFEPAEVQRIVADSRESLGASAHQVWALLMLELWHRTFIDADAA